MVSMPGSSSMGVSSSGLPKPMMSNSTSSLVVGGVVEDLHAAHLFDALADAGEVQGQPVVGEARIDAVDPQRHAPAAAAVSHRVVHRRVTTPSGYCRYTGPLDTTLIPASQEPGQVGDRLQQAVVGHGGVHDAVGLAGPAARRRRWWRSRRATGPARPAPPRHVRPWRRSTPTRPPARGRDGRRSRRWCGARRCRCSTARLDGSRGLLLRHGSAVTVRRSRFGGSCSAVTGRGSRGRGWAVGGRRRRR